MGPKTYLLRVLTLGLLFAFTVVVFNWLVDPYGIFGSQRVPGFNQYKVDINNYTRLSKRYQPQQVPHSALIVGNSRVEMGINPAHQCFRDANWQVYNLGLPGAGVRTQLEYALNLIYQQPVTQIFLSVDFTDFISSPGAAGHAMPPLAMQQRGELMYLPAGKLNPDYLETVAVDYYRSLFTLGALVSSVKTVTGQAEDAADRDTGGFNPARDFAEAVRVEGAAALFDQKTDELQRKYSNQWSLRNAEGQLDQSFDDITGFLAVAAARGVHVSIFTNPFHQSYWEIMQSMGLMPLYRDWLESIQQLVLELPGDQVSLWDFSGDSPYIQESVPAEGIRSGPLQWFWEPAHYREELGALMVNAMLSEGCGTSVLFGRRLK